jgi:DNA invertase Pin-like site-specific DNA recombinase
VAEAYVRDSTDQQDVDKQRYGVRASAHTRGLDPLQLVAETASGQLAWRERAVGRVLTAPTQGGDLVHCASVRR